MLQGSTPKKTASKNFLRNLKLDFLLLLIEIQLIPLMLGQYALSLNTVSSQQYSHEHQLSNAVQIDQRKQERNKPHQYLTLSLKDPKINTMDSNMKKPLIK